MLAGSDSENFTCVTGGLNTLGTDIKISEVPSELGVMGMNVK